MRASVGAGGVRAVRGGDRVRGGASVGAGWGECGCGLGERVLGRASAGASVREWPRTTVGSMTHDAARKPRNWHPDMLGEDFENTTLELGRDPDGEGQIVATLVRYKPAIEKPRAVLYVHGMTDYFFQAHVAEYFAERDIATYAVDLRKCGRSHREGQRWHYSHDFRQYFKELTMALGIVGEMYDDVTIMAHSTGGLIAPVWVSHLQETGAPEAAHIKRVVLNSPWLDMMYPKVLLNTLGPVAKLLGKRRPLMPAPGGNLGVYGQALHRDCNGEWDFDLQMKPIQGHEKYFGWLAAVLEFQDLVGAGKVNCRVPVLTMCSSHSLLYRRTYIPAVKEADTVLDVRQIRARQGLLSDRTELRVIEKGCHDLFLSPRPVRDEAMRVAADWILHTPGGISRPGEGAAS